MKRTFKVLLILILMLSMVLTGCGGKEAPTQGDDEEPVETEVDETETKADKVALVVAGGLGDRSFDSSHEGVEG